MFGSTVAHTQHCTEQKHKASAKEWEGPTAQRTFYAMLIHFEFGFGFSANTAANLTLHFFPKWFPHTHQYQGDGQNRPGPPAPRGGSV